MGCGASTSDTPARKSGAPHIQQEGTVRSNNGTRQPHEKDEDTRPVKSKYKNVGPSSKLLGVDVRETAMFDGDPADQLYLYVSGQRWLFYNDGNAVDMVVSYTFGSTSRIEAVGKTKLRKVADGIDCRLVVHPGDTEPFIEGEVDGYTCSLATRGLSGEYLRAKRAENQQQVDQVIAAVRAVKGSSEDPEDVLSKCIEKGIPFVDLWFTPGDAANFRPGRDEPIPPTMWQRPSDYLPSEWVPFVSIFNSIEPDDIEQGTLGNCYFLSALSCLAERPSLVEDIFRHPKGEAKSMIEQRVGAYRVTLNKGGWWHTDILDNYFPTMGNAPCYGKNLEDPAELWVQLLEKAQAKAHGSYSAVVGGDPLQAMQDLTGFPTTRIDAALLSNSPDAFTRLLAWDKQGALLTVSTPSSEEAEGDDAAARYEAAGLPLGHAFSVLQCVQVGGVSLMKIRNPWGNGVEWTGKWHDRDDRWVAHTDLAKACGRTTQDDGTFWMEWGDVCTYFNTGGACFLRRGWFDYRVRILATAGVPNAAIEINVTKPVEAFITLHQKDRRGEMPDTVDAQYGSFILSVARAEERDSSKQSIHLNATLDCEEPSPNLNFVQGRDLAMRYTFEPAHSPYVIVPRLYEQIDKSFVIGLLMDTEAGQGVDVSFVNLTAACPVYDNYLTFDLGDEVERQVAQYQYNPAEGVPVTKSGDKIEY